MDEKWKTSIKIGDVYHFSNGWRKTITGECLVWVIYARPKPKPEPKPEPTENCERLREKNMSLSQEVEYLKSTIESTNGIVETCERLQEFVAKVLPLLVEMRKNPETFSNTAPLIWDAVDEIQGKSMVK